MIHDSGISNEQWKKDMSFERDKDKACILVLCPALSFLSKEGSFG